MRQYKYKDKHREEAGLGRQKGHQTSKECVSLVTSSYPNRMPLYSYSDGFVMQSHSLLNRDAFCAMCCSLISYCVNIVQCPHTN